MPQKIELPVDEIAEKYKSGATEKVLAKEYGVNIMTISRRLYETGAKKRKVTSGRASRKRVQEWKDFIDEDEAHRLALMDFIADVMMGANSKEDKNV